MKRLTEDFNTISVKKGEAFVVDLDSQPSTGFTWDVKLSKGKATLLNMTFVSPTSQSAIAQSVGARGLQRFLFRAEEAGTIELDAEYRRNWEKEPSLKTCKLQVKVK